MWSCKSPKEVDDGETAKEDDERRDGTEFEVVPECDAIIYGAPRLLCHDQVGDATNEGEVTSYGGDPSKKKTTKRTLALLFATKIIYAIDNQDRQRHVREKIGTSDDKNGKKKYSFELV